MYPLGILPFAPSECVRWVRTNILLRSDLAGSGRTEGRVRSWVRQIAIDYPHQNTCWKNKCENRGDQRQPEPSRRFRAFQRTSERYEGEASNLSSEVLEYKYTKYIYTGGKGQYTQCVHCELIVGSETICPAHTQRVNSGHIQKVPTHLPSPNPAGK